MNNGPDRKNAVETLSALPMYQLSTAGMELFHSNMFYWLARYHPAESAPIWKLLGLPDFVNPASPPFVKREWLHTDLAFSPQGNKDLLIIENKIGAIPNARQLQGYFGGVKRHSWAVDLNLICRLLTLTPPLFDLPEPWQSVTYDQLVPALQATASRLSSEESAHVHAYVQLITGLVEVSRLYDPHADLSEPFQLGGDERELLLDSRMWSMIEKMRMSRFASLVGGELVSAYGDSRPVESGLTNSVGLVQWLVPLANGRLIGWQIQHNQFRLAVVGRPGDPGYKRGLEQLVQEQYRDFFDFSVPDSLAHLLSPYGGKRDWLGYQPNFAYRYATIRPGATWADHLQLILHFSARVRAFSS